MKKIIFCKLILILTIFSSYQITLSLPEPEKTEQNSTNKSEKREEKQIKKSTNEFPNSLDDLEDTFLEKHYYLTIGGLSVFIFGLIWLTRKN